MSESTVTVKVDLDLAPLIETLRKSADTLASIYAGTAAHCPPEQPKVLGYVVLNGMDYLYSTATFDSRGAAEVFIRRQPWTDLRVVAVVEVPNA